MTPFPRLSSDWEKLFALDGPTLDRRLVGIFESCEADPRPIEFDRLMGVGIKFARAGQEDKDKVALEWLANAQSPKRIDIVSAFLGGDWQPSVRLRPLRPETVERFISLRRGIEIDDEAAYSSLALLAETGVSTASPEIRRLVELAMKSEDPGTYRSPEMAEQARKLVSTALGRLGESG
jgi:hypothetical protein